MSDDTVDVPVKFLKDNLAELESLMESIGKGHPGYTELEQAAIKIRWMLKDVPEDDLTGAG